MHRPEGILLPACFFHPQSHIRCGARHVILPKAPPVTAGFAAPECCITAERAVQHLIRFRAPAHGNSQPEQQHKKSVRNMCSARLKPYAAGAV
jgi:hypothetical protein